MKKFLFFFFLLLVCPLYGIRFNQKWSIPDGILWYLTVPKGADSDHDGMAEIVFTSESLAVPVIYEIYNDQFHLEHIIDTTSSNYYFWGIGEFDGDSFEDALIEHWLGHGQESYIRAYESSDYHSYPDTMVWEDLLYGFGAGELFFGDFDNDGKMNFMKDAVRYFWIYENISDNYYQLVFKDSIPKSQCLEGGAIADFDGDGKTEIAYGDLYGRVFVVENTADNQYELVWDTTIYASMCYDNFSVKDADQDGKPEFVIHSYYYHPHCTQKVWIFEANGDNSYELVYMDSTVTPWTDSQGPISDAGDIDGDGIPELVISGTTAWYVLKATGSNRYEKVFYYEPTPPEGWLIQLDIDIYDLDHNGLNDVITSWTWTDYGGWIHARTEIFEKGIDMEWLYPSERDTFLWDSLVLLRWSVTDTISIESLYIYLQTAYPSIPHGRDLIFQGDPMRDSTFLWKVPDSTGYYRLWLVVTGKGRRDSIRTPMILIMETGVKEKQMVTNGREGFLSYTSNPVRLPVEVVFYLEEVPDRDARLRIVDVTGRVVRAFRGLRSGYNKVIWDGRDDRGEPVSRGVYFIMLERDRRKWVRRVVLWR